MKNDKTLVRVERERERERERAIILDKIEAFICHAKKEPIICSRQIVSTHINRFFCYVMNIE